MDNVRNPLKRDLDPVDSKEPALKRQRFDNPFVMTSNLFSNDFDQKQFQAIFKSLDNLPLIITENVTEYISKTIAEYTTGDWKKCANEKCNESISILQQNNIWKYCNYQYCHNKKCNECVYDEHGTISRNIGYKHCHHSDRYSCSECI